MESARCTQNNAIYSAQQFAGLAADDLEEKRQNLVCPACGRHAFFRKETQNDRDPFGARPHAEGCNLSAAQAAATASDQADTYEDLLNPNKRIKVNFTHERSATVDQHPHAGVTQSTRTHDESAGYAGFSPATVRSMRLRPLLRLLISTPEFRTSPQIVDMDGIGSVRACDFFVPIKSLSAQHERFFKGVFGKVMSAQYIPQDKAVWLNSGSCFEPSICIPVELAALLLDRFEINNVGYFANANVLVFGTVRISQHGKKYLVLENPYHFMADFSRDQ